MATPYPQWQVEDGDDFVMVMLHPQSSAETLVKTVDWSTSRIPVPLFAKSGTEGMSVSFCPSRFLLHNIVALIK